VRTRQERFETGMQRSSPAMSMTISVGTDRTRHAETVCGGDDAPDQVVEAQRVLEHSKYMTV
jgi:hypothetical protein